MTLVQERDRAKIPDKHKWNLAEIYPSDQAWLEAKSTIAPKIPEFGRFKGKLMSSAAVLADALEEMFRLDKELWRLSGYAGLLADQDTRDGRHQGMRQEVIQLRTSFDSHTSFIYPEILQTDVATVHKLIATESRLAIYRIYLEEMFRRQPHTLSESEEKILAGSGVFSGAPSMIHNILLNADFPKPSVTLSDGESTRLDQAAYLRLRALPNRADRENVVKTFFNSLGEFSRTFAATLDGKVQTSLFFANARKYESSLKMALDGPNIPVSVYSRLIEGVNRHIPTFHRYLTLRKQMLRLDSLRYYDVHAPLTASVTTTYTPEEAQDEVLAAVATLGPEYCKVARRSFEERWIDLFPNDGKRAGAYSDSEAFDVHPYILMNFVGTYRDVSTLAHELGHAMHSYLSNRAQPYPLAGYSTFVAEVASTFNESLLVDHMLRTASDVETKLSLLGNYVENVRAAVFRPAQFAEFEQIIHEMAQKGEPIVGEALAALFLNITRKYYGHDNNICVVEDYIGHEWSLVPHFYSDFYMFQYATSFAASEALAARVKSGDENARKRYLALLSAGGTKYPIDLLKDAGVDMTTDEPLDLTMASMNRAMDEMERLLTGCEELR
jgi:oligoendopeptidase F